METLDEILNRMTGFAQISRHNLNSVKVDHVKFHGEFDNEDLRYLGSFPTAESPIEIIAHYQTGQNDSGILTYIRDSHGTETLKVEKPENLLLAEFSKTMNHNEYYSKPLNDLPWDKLNYSARVVSRAKSSLIRVVSASTEEIKAKLSGINTVDKMGSIVEIGETYEFIFRKMDNETFLMSRNIGDKTYQILTDVFGLVGMQLPENPKK